MSSKAEGAAMQKVRVMVSLITENNDYQIEQSSSAQSVAHQLGVETKIVFADGDAVTQSTQILKAIHGDPELRPHAVVAEPAGGTALPQVARAAVDAGVLWVILNRDASYLPELRQKSKVAVFGVTSDQVEIGRIQARQCAAMLPCGGSILYIQGPSEASVSKERFQGLQEVKPANIHLAILKGQWTEESSARVVRSWLALSTSRKAKIDLVVSQNDLMAMGVRKAIQETISEMERDAWLNIPYLGIDGVPKTGQAWVRTGLLAATVVVPPSAGPAIQLLVDAIRTGKVPPERVVMESTSYPPLESLRAKVAHLS
jgi:ribose transport system substrate-binding protein